MSEPTCPSCGHEWTAHRGIALTCARATVLEKALRELLDALTGDPRSNNRDRARRLVRARKAAREIL